MSGRGSTGGGGGCFLAIGASLLQALHHVQHRLHEGLVLHRPGDLLLPQIHEVFGGLCIWISHCPNPEIVLKD
jgi:hypothetical protein